jgi:sulfur transfer complex TusBCD TusB component (DsrH family)
MMFTRLYVGENDEMGKCSFRDILITISESELVPRTLVFWNNAVKACVEGSPLLATINKIEKLGVRVLVAGHALDKLNLKGALRAGKLANHFDLLEAINQVQKVVNL